jgi:hypothetical protein
MSVHDERIKLRANALDRLSTAFLTVGVVTPVAGLVTGVSRTDTPFWVLALIFYGFLLTGIILHLLARRELGGLQE